MIHCFRFWGRTSHCTQLRALTLAGALLTALPILAQEYAAVLGELLEMRAEESVVAEVADLVIRRDVGEFLLEEGDLYLCSPVGDRLCAAYFQGRGRFSFTPPTQIERDQLFRFYETERFEQKFRTLFLLFADSTETELRRRLNFSGGNVHRKVNDGISYAMKYLGDRKKQTFDYSIIKTLLEGQKSPLFYAHFSWDKTLPFFFKIDPYTYEEVRFMRRMKGPSYLTLHEIINQFPMSVEMQDSPAGADSGIVSVDITAYRLKCRMEGSQLKFSATAEVDFLGYGAPQSWLMLALYEELEMDSVTWSTGEPAHYIKGEGSPMLWVALDPPLKPDEARTLKLSYHGRLIERQRDWFYIRSTKGWYPRHGTLDRAEFDMTFLYPEKFRFAAVGEQVERQVDGEEVLERWRTRRPIRNASFNVGFFREYQIENDTIPPVQILMSETGHRDIARELASQGIGSGRNMHLEVGEDIRLSMAHFLEVFGSPQEERYFVTEIPYTHGEAFPGLMHLAWTTFQRSMGDGSDRVFRAHEVAHQWWGIGVDRRSYHDLWISEGFSEFAAWWYLETAVQRRKEDLSEFHDYVRHWREEIAGNRKFLLGDGQKAAPIWLGNRTHSSDTEGDYSLIIYKKGAWVLHMLRMMTRDLPSLDDSRFREMISRFYQQYLGENVSTEMFIEHAENALTMDLQWFFDQWVYGTGIPRYRCASIVESSPEGGYLLRCRVLQENVSESFRMPLLIGIDLNDGPPLPVRMEVDGPVSEAVFGPFSARPARVEFNYMESVLCELDEESW